MILTRECPGEKHVPRDNWFAVTWCIRCGKLFNKPCGKELTIEDKLLFKTL